MDFLQHYADRLRGLRSVKPTGIGSLPIWTIVACQYWTNLLKLWFIHEFYFEVSRINVMSSFISISGSYNHGTVSFVCLSGGLFNGVCGRRKWCVKDRGAQIDYIVLSCIFWLIFLLALLYFLVYLRFLFICLSVYVPVSVLFFTDMFPKHP